MKGGILEVLLVNAEGIQHTNLLGRPAYYVLLQCGSQTHKSKISSANDEEVCWNEKFMFEFPLSDWKNVTHLKLRIMDKEFFKHNGFAGETIIHLEGIITEGTDKGFIEVKPAPHVVVLEDDTYRGQIRIGLKFISDVEVHTREREYVAVEIEPRQSVCTNFLSFWKISWRKWFFLYSKTSPKSKQKQI